MFYLSLLHILLFSRLFFFVVFFSSLYMHTITSALPRAFTKCVLETVSSDFLHLCPNRGRKFSLYVTWQLHAFKGILLLAKPGMKI